MNRRNVLIGLGGVVAGGGALLGTGAFTTVEAQRTVSVETAGDADAFLGLAAARDNYQEENFVTEGEDGTIQINLDEDSPGEGDGLNQNARTVFRNLVTVSNQGTQTVDEITLEFDDNGSVDASDTFSFPVDDDDGNTDEVDNGENILTGENDVPDELDPGEDINFGIEIDLLEGGDDGDLPEDDYTLTIEAHAAD